MPYQAKYFLGLKVIACFKAIRGIGALLLALSVYCSAGSQWPVCQMGANLLGDNNVIAPILFPLQNGSIALINQLSLGLLQLL